MNRNKSLFQQYTPRQNRHFQSELQNNGKAKAKIEQPDYMGKGANDYKHQPKHHIGRKLSAILVSIGAVIVALVIVGATASYHRDAPSTTSPNVMQQQTKPRKKNRIVHKIKKIRHKKKHKIKRDKPKSKDNIIQVTNNHAKVEPRKDVENSKISKSSTLKPMKPKNVKKGASIKDSAKFDNNKSPLKNINNTQKTSTKSQP